MPLMVSSAVPKLLSFLGLLLFINQGLLAQFKIIPIPIKQEKNTHLNHRQARTTQDGPLALPFWDDFSTSHKFPDTALWLGSQNVSISRGAGIQPPTFNVATFDGTDANGNVYSENEISVGLADSLLSKPIDLSGIGLNFQNTVYLSFFWQLEGFGEIPDPEDSIRLQFRDVNDNWVTIWSMTGGDPTISDVFTQETFQLDPVLFYHENFQFKFESFSRLTGVFDTWQIDYILLNKGRNGTDLSHLDHAITSYPTSLFGRYTAVPTTQFYSEGFDAADKLTGASVGYFNLDKFLQPIEYTAFVTDTIRGEILDTLNFNEPDPSIPGPFARDTYTTNLLDIGKVGNVDSAVLELTFYINTGDTLLVDEVIGTDTTFTDRFDLRSNDTITTYFTINDYFSYDDGSAEFGAGINQTGGRLAYQYELFTEDTLTAVDIYFPNIGADFSGTPIELFVWRDLEDSETSILAELSTTVKSTIGINEVQSYELNPPIVVNGNIYIGYRQSTDQRLPVGLDMNTDTGDRIFFNVLGQWEQNTEIAGSLLMRPRFGRGAVVTGIDDDRQPDKVLKIFPNPSSGRFHIEGAFDKVILYSSSGQQIPLKVLKTDLNSATFDITGLAMGIYQLRIFKGGKSFSKRIMLME
ncbi:T9SS type A sorting domain-containing protein [Fulvivirgaceae bacterium BMA12]|uniref:T9SS type A sorting domain-containing protein n=1 Tax=Agaribacillus aureus TaxID=3051825 RepID=A0ABT8L7U6_9BACT|nr:T9SS type A sorting domain-containing protein [Fulvivirgaceae bacterium BMA12]